MREGFEQRTTCFPKVINRNLLLLRSCMEQDLKEDLPSYYYHSYEMSKTAKISFF